MPIFNRPEPSRVTRFSSGLGMKLASSAAYVPFRNGMRGAPVEKPVMSNFMRRMSRRTIVQALIALPALSLFRNQPAVVDPDEIVEVNFI